MCGGIMLSQSLKNESKNKFEAMKPAILYNLGRVIAYSILGGIVGAIGSVFSLSITAQAGLQIFAGVFMIMMGLNMAGFSAFRKFQIKLPAAVCKMQSKPKSPLFVGIFNGFMPCGPLQTMQIFALGTGSALAGAFSMFMFALGTVPLMLTFGAVSGLLSKGYTKKILKFSGVLIMVLGLIMGNRGLALAGMNMSPKAVMAKIGALGTGDDAAAPANAVKASIKNGTQVLNMTVSGQGYTPNFLYVQKGIPVKWELDAQQLTGCNSTIVIPSLNIKQKLESGKNTIEFTPGDEDLSFSCWMGMLSGTIKVVDDLKSVSTSTSKASGNDSASGSTSGSTVPSQPSIYGDDISQVATDRLVKKAQVTNNEQTLAVKGIGYELEPLIMVTNTGIPTKLSLDLTAFDQPDGNFTIKDANTQQVITKFVGQKGIVEVGFTIDKAGSYGIYIDENILGMIDVADDLNSVNLDEVRSKYIQQ
jgi:plastocyanin domain-containing protein/sulfite exporter TauE/SafE